MVSSDSKSVAVVITSVRGVRVGPEVGDFVTSTLSSASSSSSNTTLHTVDLAKFNLPVYNEPIAPAMIGKDGAAFKQDTSKAWADEISKYDGYIFVVNEYNYGMSGATKNAIDYLYHGFRDKPVVVVSYGIGGGKTANEQVKGAFTGMGLTVVEPRIELPFHGNVGPDLFAAMGTGKLGEDTKKDWEETKKDEVLKAFEALNGELRKPKVQEGTQPVPAE